MTMSSGRRPALTISSNEFNGSYATAIAPPMSSTMPAERYRTRQHAYISDTGSCPTPVHIRHRFMGIDQTGESGAPTPVGRHDGPGLAR